MQSQFISSFHFIIEDLFKNEYSLLWNIIKIGIYYKCLNKFNNKEDELNMDYFEYLKKFNSNEEISFNNEYTIPFEKLIPENFETNNNNNNL